MKKFQLSIINTKFIYSDENEYFIGIKFYTNGFRIGLFWYHLCFDY
jgi:hypothetical protein